MPVVEKSLRRKVPHINNVIQIWAQTIKIKMLSSDDSKNRNYNTIKTNKGFLENQLLKECQLFQECPLSLQGRQW